MCPHSATAPTHQVPPGIAPISVVGLGAEGAVVTVACRQARVGACHEGTCGRVSFEVQGVPSCAATYSTHASGELTEGNTRAKLDPGATRITLNSRWYSWRDRICEDHRQHGRRCMYT